MSSGGVPIRAIGNRVILSTDVRAYFVQRIADGSPLIAGEHHQARFLSRNRENVPIRLCSHGSCLQQHTRTVSNTSVSGKGGRNARANPTTLRIGAQAGRGPRKTSCAPAVRVLRRGQYQPGGTDASIPFRRLSALLVPFQPAEATNRPCITLRRAHARPSGGARRSARR
jgi:hypothetical protein